MGKKERKQLILSARKKIKKELEEKEKLKERLEEKEIEMETVKLKHTQIVQDFQRRLEASQTTHIVLKRLKAMFDSLWTLFQMLVIYSSSNTLPPLSVGAVGVMFVLLVLANNFSQN